MMDDFLRKMKEIRENLLYLRFEMGFDLCGG